MPETEETYENIGQLIMERLEDIEDLPSLPLVIMKLTAEIQNPDSTASRVARIMEEDPAIMARVLKVVNSSFYSSAYADAPIENVQHAIVRLGFDAIRNIALTSSVFTIFKEDHKKVFDRTAFWRHCICTGLIANVIARYARAKSGIKVPPETVALGGLLHGIGKIVLEQHFYDLFTRILEYARDKKVPLLAVEKNVFNLSHSEIGAWLARRWKLSKDIIACIEHYQEPDGAPEDFKDMVSMVHIADYICNLKGFGQSGNTVVPYFDPMPWKRLGLDVGIITDVMDEVEKEAAKSEILLALRNS